MMGEDEARDKGRSRRGGSVADQPDQRHAQGGEREAAQAQPAGVEEGGAGGRLPHLGREQGPEDPLNHEDEGEPGQEVAHAPAVGPSATSPTAGSAPSARPAAAGPGRRRRPAGGAAAAPGPSRPPSGRRGSGAVSRRLSSGRTRSAATARGWSSRR